MPLRGPTCKIARFQAGLKFPSWTECGKNINGEAKKLTKLASQFVLNFFGYKHPRRLANNIFERWDT